MIRQSIAFNAGGKEYIAILGGAAVVAEELCYRHALLVNPGTGKIAVTPASYQPASGPVDASAQYAAAG